MSGKSLLGIDVGGTNLRLGIVSGKTVLRENRRQADFSRICAMQPADQALAEILDALAASIAVEVDSNPEIAAIGIGFPGFIDPKTSKISRSPNLPGLLDVDLAGPLARRFGIPVVIENDANCAAFGEFMLAGGEGNLLYIGLGTGVGGGLILQGLPHGGDTGVAMEIGHLIVEPSGRSCGCGNSGCLEQYASASGVAKSYFEFSGKMRSSGEIAILAAAGDHDAIRAYSLAGEMLGFALAHIQKVVDVRNVVVGGGMSGAWNLLAESFERRLEDDLIPALKKKIRVMVSDSQDLAGMLGAALLARRRLE